MKTAALSAVPLLVLLSSTAAFAVEPSVKIVLINTGGVEAGTDAFYGFKTAAKFWEQHLTAAQPTTITFAVGFSRLPPDVLGSTGSNYTTRSVQSVEGRIVSSGRTALDAQVAGNLPGLTPGQYGVGALDVYTPGYTGIDPVNGPYGIDNATRVYDTDGSINNSYIALTTANAKALGYGIAPGTVDASISFSSEFAFDFNPKDGITARTSDFIGVATHEMAHALGFVSGVDDYDFYGTGGPVPNEPCLNDGTLCKNLPANDFAFGQTLDLFRYSAAGALDWTTKTASYFSVDGGTTAYQNGLFSTGTFSGDSWQASHWKAPQVVDPATGDLVFSCRRPKLGIMNPYLCGGANGIVTGLDLAALDAIGYNTNFDVNTFVQSTAGFSSYVPEPASWGMMIAGFGLVGALQRRRRTGIVTA